jgi:hypothetical protein
VRYRSLAGSLCSRWVVRVGVGVDGLGRARCISFLPYVC